jgi:transcription antitermination factor NusG
MEEQQPVWFVMRFLFNHKSDTRERLGKEQIETFIPMRDEVITRGGRKILARVPVIKSLLFVRATARTLDPFLETDRYFQYQYRRGGKQAEPLVVPDDQMEQFIHATRVAERPMYFTPTELNIARGTRIRILGGPLDGIVGVLLKVKGARRKRLVLEIPNMLAVAVEVDPDLVEVLS